MQKNKVTKDNTLITKSPKTENYQGKKQSGLTSEKFIQGSLDKGKGLVPLTSSHYLV